MTVAELIDKLRQEPGESRVFLNEDQFLGADYDVKDEERGNIVILSYYNFGETVPDDLPHSRSSHRRNRRDV